MLAEARITFVQPLYQRGVCVHMNFVFYSSNGRKIFSFFIFNSNRRVFLVSVVSSHDSRSYGRTVTLAECSPVVIFDVLKTDPLNKLWLSRKTEHCTGSKVRL